MLPERNRSPLERVIPGFPGYPGGRLRAIMRGRPHSKGRKAAALPTAHFLHLVSDSTGETASAAANAVLSQFDDPDVDRRLHVFVRNASDVAAALEDIRAHPGVVVYTILDETLASQVREGCQRMGVPAVPLLDPLFETLSRILGPARSRRPGKQYETDRLYFERVAAIEYAMAP